MDFAPGTMVTPNVRLVERLAAGGMGSIWLADHLGLESRVAVKFITPELVGKEPTLRERFKREAGICARLRSAHVVQIFDHGAVTDGTQYIVMELLEGITLTRMVEIKGRLSMREVNVIIAQVCRVLNRAHQLGIIHRDIKPDNIFLSDERGDSDEELFVKVLDFGIAKHTQQPRGADVVTKTGAIVGSPEFMSPEQAINSKDVDHRSDLFSLAVVAYYALTGELPFGDDDERPFWIQLSSGEFKVPTLRVPRLPAAVDPWFKRALSPKPADRFQRARDMADAFAFIADKIADPEILVEDERPTIHLMERELDQFSDEATMRMKPREVLDAIPRTPSIPGALRTQSIAGTPRSPGWTRMESAPTQLMAPPRKPRIWPLVLLLFLVVAIATGAYLFIRLRPSLLG